MVKSLEHLELEDTAIKEQVFRQVYISLYVTKRAKLNNQERENLLKKILALEEKESRELLMYAEFYSSRKFLPFQANFI